VRHSLDPTMYTFFDDLVFALHLLRADLPVDSKRPPMTNIGSSDSLR